MSYEPLHDAVTAVPGVGPARARLLENLGLHTVEQLLYYAPRRHLDARRVVSIAELVDGQRATVVGTVVETERRSTRTPGLWLARAVVSDTSGARLELVSFVRGKGGRRPRHIPLPAPDGTRVIVSGVARRRRDGVWEMQQAEVERTADEGIRYRPSRPGVSAYGGLDPAHDATHRPSRAGEVCRPSTRNFTPPAASKVRSTVSCRGFAPTTFS